MYNPDHDMVASAYGDSKTFYNLNNFIDPQEQYTEHLYSYIDPAPPPPPSKPRRGGKPPEPPNFRSKGMRKYHHGVVTLPMFVQVSFYLFIYFFKIKFTFIIFI